MTQVEKGTDYINAVFVNVSFFIDLEVYQILCSPAAVHLNALN